jgi:dissimilatory sulfite reductase (desulfoviridin) alpha/beta subunit
MLFLPDEKVLDFIGQTLDWYIKNGKRGERVGTTIDRVGFESYRKEVARPFISS